MCERGWQCGDLANRWRSGTPTLPLTYTKASIRRGGVGVEVTLPVPLPPGILATMPPYPYKERKSRSAHTENILRRTTYA